MDIKGILFDKDGTLIEFHSFWVQAAKRVVPEFLTENQISPDQKHADVVMEAMGVFGDDIDPNGALAYKSNKEIAEEITEALAQNFAIIKLLLWQMRMWTEHTFLPCFLLCFIVLCRS